MLIGFQAADIIKADNAGVSPNRLEYSFSDIATISAPNPATISSTSRGTATVVTTYLGGSNAFVSLSNTYFATPLSVSKSIPSLSGSKDSSVSHGLSSTISSTSKEGVVSTPSSLSFSGSLVTVSLSHVSSLIPISSSLKSSNPKNSLAYATKTVTISQTIEVIKTMTATPIINAISVAPDPPLSPVTISSSYIPQIFTSSEIPPPGFVLIVANSMAPINRGSHSTAASVTALPASIATGDPEAARQQQQRRQRHLDTIKKLLRWLLSFLQGNRG